MATDKKLLTKEVINFFFKKDECKSLSNFWECEIKIVDKDSGEIREYESGEHCYHGEKFIRVGKDSMDENRKTKLLDYGYTFMKGGEQKSGAMIKKLGRKLILSEDELNLWYHKFNLDVQREICSYKFKNYEQVRLDLIYSKGKVLIHPAMRCSEEKVKESFWFGKGVVVDGKVEILGQNMFGKLWMDLRDTL